MIKLLAVAATGFAVAAPAPALAASAPSPKSPYVVTFKDAVADSDRAVEALRGKSRFSAKFRYRSAVKGFAADLDAGQLAEIRSDPRVAFVEPDRVFTVAGKPASKTTTAPAPVGELVPAGIRRIGAATATGAKGAGAGSVAVLDTGIDLANGDLNAAHGVNCVQSGSQAKDDNGHGTHVAGVIGARDNDTGVLGVAPGTKVYAVKILNSRSTGTLSQFLCGIEWVTVNAKALDIRVANMSVAGSGSDDGNCGNTNGDSQHKAICRSVAAGINYVVAAGNSAKDIATTVPAAYSEVLTVTAITDTDGTGGAKGPTVACKRGEADDRYGAYSNFAANPGAAAHTVAAPGTCVVSTKSGGGTATYYGTSQAAPHAAGAVALCLGSVGGAGPCAGLAPAQVIQRIRSDAAAKTTALTGFAGDPLQPVTGRTYGHLVAADVY